ncbi:carboxylesterase/lipase family protein [Microbulbifer agarilyticus]
MSPIAVFESNQWIGVSEQSRSGTSIQSFRGIRYAQPPTGKRRWQAPSPYPLQTGPVSAQKFGAACIQTSYNTDWYVDVIQAFGGDTAQAPAPAEMSEDCLFLNIWTPTRSKAEETPTKRTMRSLPVMVFIHGGNNLGGWGHEPNYLGAELAASDVVVVTINYRLGIFGFFAHPELSLESPYKSSGNAGLLDQIEALRWVQKHIAAFGGDPQKVTVFGESAGGANIGYLMQSPLAAGLFQQAIRQSGTFDIYQNSTLADEESYGSTLQKRLGVFDLAGLRALTAEEILQAGERIFRNVEAPEGMQSFYPVRDGKVLPLDIHAEKYALPLMVGFNRDESLMYTDHTVVVEDLKRWQVKYFSTAAKRTLNDKLDPAAQNHDEQSIRKRFAALQDATWYDCSAVWVADRSAENAATFVYRFDRERMGQREPQIGVYHGAELPYIFGSHDAWLPTVKGDHTVSRMMQKYWTNFARYGDPNGPGLAHWPKHESGATKAQLIKQIPEFNIWGAKDLCQHRIF